MYPVSNAYLNKLKSIGEKERKISGTIDSYAFTDDDLLEGSFSYTDIAVKSAEIKLGGVFIGSLSMTVLKGHLSSISRGSWKGRIINVNISTLTGLDENEHQVWEPVPLKPYKIVEANHTALGVDIKAEDAMADFDKPIAMNVTSGNLYGMLTLACNSCNVELGMTQSEVEDLPNGTETLGLYPDNDIETYRDFISWVAVTIGGFATIDRQGKLVLRVWHTTPDLEIGPDVRFEGGTWSDFSTNYTAITVKNIADDTESYYKVTPDNGLTLDIGANPLLQYGADEIKTAQREAVLSAVRNLRYVPFTSSSLLDPALDLGDVISYPDGVANNAICCVMRIDFSFRKGATVKGYGKNPALIGARSKADKAIAQASKSNKEQGITYYTYINTTAINLTDTFQRLYRIIFITTEKTTVTLWNEIKWLNTLSESTQKITYQYYLDGVKFDYEPIDTIGEDGYHSIPHPFWLLDVSGGETHYWEVRAKVDSGTATIAIGDLHALLQGQKLAADISFDGTIEIEEEITTYVFGRNIVPLTDSMALVRRSPDRNLMLQQTVGTYQFGRLIVPLSDEIISIDRDHNPAVIVDESETYNIVDEDGTHNIKTEAWY